MKGDAWSQLPPLRRAWLRELGIEQLWLTGELAQASEVSPGDTSAMAMPEPVVEPPSSSVTPVPPAGPSVQHAPLIARGSEASCSGGTEQGAAAFAVRRLAEVGSDCWILHFRRGQGRSGGAAGGAHHVVLTRQRGEGVRALLVNILASMGAAPCGHGRRLRMQSDATQATQGTVVLQAEEAAWLQQSTDAYVWVFDDELSSSRASSGGSGTNKPDACTELAFSAPDGNVIRCVAVAFLPAPFTLMRSAAAKRSTLETMLAARSATV